MSDSLNLADHLREVVTGDENILEIIEKITDDAGDVKEKKTTVSLANKPVQPEPVALPARMESPRRVHRFAAVDGFIKFLSTYGENPVVLADVCDKVIAAVLDPAAVDGFEVVTMRPVFHPLIIPWLQIFGKAHAVTDFAALVMQNRRSIKEPDGREVALTFSQVRGAVKIQMARGRGNKTVNGVMVETEIQGERKNEPVDLPDTLTIRAPLFVDTDEAEIVVDLLVLADRSGDVSVTASSPDIEQRIIESFELMVGQVDAAIDDAVVGLGKIEHTPWDRIVDRYPDKREQ